MSYRRLRTSGAAVTPTNVVRLSVADSASKASMMTTSSIHSFTPSLAITVKLNTSENVGWT